jgi:hypothetical protein
VIEEVSGITKVVVNLVANMDTWPLWLFQVALLFPIWVIYFQKWYHGHTGSITTVLYSK